jgi:hypothetical protein
LLALNPNGVDRLLRAPALARHLLFETGHNQGSALLADAINVETALSGTGFRPDRPLWAALGDALVHPEGAIWRSPAVAGLASLDIGSPAALAIDLSGAAEQLPPDNATGAYQKVDLDVVVRRLQLVAEALSEVGEPVTSFVRIFNQVIILRPQPEFSSFSSGSNGHYPGRTVLANAHLDSIGPMEIAEALVHEGVHALLYMEQYPNRWVTEPTSEQVVSPWTGRHLSLRQFLEACFVWSALVHFWSLALNRSSLLRQAAPRMLARSVRGFLTCSLLDMVSEREQRIVRPDVVEAVGHMQERIRAAADNLSVDRSR